MQGVPSAGLTIGRSWGSTSADNDESFTTVRSRQEMKNDKRKEISPVNDGRNYPSEEASHMSKRYKAGVNS